MHMHFRECRASIVYQSYCLFNIVCCHYILQSIDDNAGNDVTANEGALKEEQRAEDTIDQVGSACRAVFCC